MSLKNFTEMSKFNRVSADTIQRKLRAEDQSHQELFKIAQSFFSKNNTLYLVCDETFSHHKYSKLIEGTDDHFDSKIHHEIRSHKILAFGITDGKHILPLSSYFLFGKMLPEKQSPSRIEIIQKMIIKTKNDFPMKKIILVADGAFGKIEMLKWCIQNKVDAEFRMTKSYKVMFQNKSEKIQNIKNLQPKGKQMARTIKAIWHEMNLYLTAQKRIDKKGNETIVYQVSTYFSKPSQHVKVYKKRWTIEKMFRTTKQYLGLQDCQSTKMQTQKNHIAAVFLAYSHVVVEQKRKGLKSAEEAISALKLKNERISNKCNSLKRTIQSSFSVNY
jgi:hypothetical protein